MNIETEDLGQNEYDVVWCDLILHHLVPNLATVMKRIHGALRTGGLFIAREPVAYAPWLKAIRSVVPVHVPTTPDEQPLRASEFEIIESVFPDLKRQYYRILARADRVTASLRIIALLAKLDRLLLKVPMAQSLAGNVVMWAKK